MPLTRPKVTQLQSSTTQFDDPIIELNKSATGANTNDLGIIINRGSSGDNVGIIWDRSAQSFVLATTTADGDSSGDLSLSAYADLEVKDLNANSIAVDTSITVNGNNVLTEVSTVDADTLGTLTPSQFLRSDEADTMSGNLTVTGWVRVGNNYTLPAADGSNGQVLKTNGSGTVTWQADSGGGGDAHVVKSQMFASGTDYSTTSASDVNMSDLFTYTPEYTDGTTKFIIIFKYYGVIASGNDARTSSRLSYYDGTSYVDTGNTNVEGIVHSGTDTSVFYYSSVFTEELTSSALRSDNNNLSIRLKGHSDYGNLFTVASHDMYVMEVLA